MLNTFERWSLAVESVVEKWVRWPEFNPLYHTGTLATFCLLIILVTGVYLTLFYQFGFEASYLAVEKIEASLIGRIMRALHKYASGGAMIFTLLHGWRIFFMDRFRGPRWLAWVSGMGMVVLLWAIGVTGYWMIWDERAAVLNQTLFRLVENSSLGVSFLLDFIVTRNAGSGWIFMVFLITAHLGLSAVVGGLLWVHLKRLSRPKWLPPRYWMGIVLGVLVGAAVLIPVGMAPRASAGSFPAAVPMDAWYLSYLPAALHWPPWVFWGGIIVLVGIFCAVPWLLIRKPFSPIQVDAARCTGCTLCEADCPYRAISMVERTDSSEHKYLAVVDSKFCVSCGVCVGSCPPLALSFQGRPELLWEQVEERVRTRLAEKEEVRVVFTCERHAQQGMLPSFQTSSGVAISTEVFPLICIGMAHPDLAARALEAGASDVRFIGCPLEDCANREGNVFLDERLARERKPKLQLAYVHEPISAAWIPPKASSAAVLNPASFSTPSSPVNRATAYRFELSQTTWRRMMPGLVLLGLALVVQIGLSNLVYHPFEPNEAWIEVALEHQAGYPLRAIGMESLLESPVLNGNTPVQLNLEMDGEALMQKVYSAQTIHTFDQISVPSGQHHIRLFMVDQFEQIDPLILFDQIVVIEPGQAIALHFENIRLGGDPVRGEELYYELALGRNVSCRVCHSLEPDVRLVGPSFDGIATRAESRVPGLSAEAYLRQSILDPDAYVVEGYPSGQMLQDFDEILNDEELDDLIAFLLTLK